MTDEPTRHRLEEIPPAVPKPQAARAFAREVNSGAFLRRINRMARAARLANHESMAALVKAAQDDGMQLSVGRISRLETRSQRNEVDAIALLYILLRGGYDLPDLYPPAGGTSLTEEEQTLLRNYRAAPPSTRGEIVRYSGYMARGIFADERPSNVHALPRPERTEEDEFASDELAHEAHAKVQEQRERIQRRRESESQTASRKHKRRFYGNGG